VTIIVAEDSETFRSLIKKALMKICASEQDILPCADRQMVLDQVAKSDIEIILLDWTMPGKSGMQVLRELKAKGKLQQITVIRVTAIANRSNILEALKMGVKDYIVKPIDKDALSKKLCKFLGDDCKGNAN